MIWWRNNTLDPASDQQDLNTAIEAPLLIWLSTVHNLVDLAMKAIPCMQIENTSKGKEECNSIAENLEFKHTKLGSHKLMNNDC